MFKDDSSYLNLGCYWTHFSCFIVFQKLSLEGSKIVKIFAIFGFESIFIIFSLKSHKIFLQSLLVFLKLFFNSQNYYFLQFSKIFFVSFDITQKNRKTFSRSTAWNPSNHSEGLCGCLKVSQEKKRITEEKKTERERARAAVHTREDGKRNTESKNVECSDKEEKKRVEIFHSFYDYARRSS